MSFAARAALSLCAWTAAILVPAALAVRHLRVVLSPSLPRGLYFAVSPPPRLAPGDLVAFCPSAATAQLLLSRHLVPRGTCPSGTVPLAKRLLAHSPYLCAEPNGLLVDHLFLPWPQLPKTLPWPRVAHCGPTSPTCLIVVGESIDAIDSRTFGCVDLQAVQSKLYPLLTERGDR